MKFIVDVPTEEHIVFAWFPVLVFDRAASIARTVWLEKVSRRMVSVQGATFWVYSQITPLKEVKFD